MKNILFGILLLSVLGCSNKDKYDVSRYYNLKEEDEVLASIVTYLFDAPPYTSMKDRFESKHVNYYSNVAARFSIEKYYIAKDGTHYFYVIRPASTPKEKRAVGGHFKIKDSQLTDFREEFVTPVLPEADVKGRCAFLFDEMVKGNLAKYKEMKSYIQWPNPISYYDTITYEWKLNPDLEKEKPERDSL